MVVEESLMKATCVLTSLLILAISHCALADTFGSGANTFDIGFVTVGNPGNPADLTGAPNPAGSVPYVYRMGKFEISEQMIDKANTLGALGITTVTRSANKPATFINWFEAARFANWLNTSTGRTPAYKFVGSTFQAWAPIDPGYDPTNPYRNKLAGYVLPSVNEMYKAAYYDPASGACYNYPTGSNVAPSPVTSGTAPGTAVYAQPQAAGPADVMLAGGLSPSGTMGQAANVWEWDETDRDLVNDNSSPPNRGFRGGNWYNSANDFDAANWSWDTLFFENDDLGFRVASTFVPEPSAIVLITTGFSVRGLRRSKATNSHRV
jgi:formylglycine-generating enzyme